MVQQAQQYKEESLQENTIQNIINEYIASPEVQARMQTMYKDSAYVTMLSKITPNSVTNLINDTLSNVKPDLEKMEFSSQIAKVNLLNTSLLSKKPQPSNIEQLFINNVISPLADRLNVAMIYQEQLNWRSAKLQDATNEKCFKDFSTKLNAANIIKNSIQEIVQTKQSLSKVTIEVASEPKDNTGVVFTVSLHKLENSKSFKRDKLLSKCKQKGLCTFGKDNEGNKTIVFTADNANAVISELRASFEVKKLKKPEKYKNNEQFFETNKAKILNNSQNFQK